ncbi:ribosomal protein S18-alanine N-acetyltransferase [Robertmurraya korlensis]|jgi:[ribosomal protein S18]-alanine N-acetyltransferase|uniref:ribosomal protein S18-alanine N-acetyltransferase n=1 Tax=Robertmurraya korlensis TaxID=519977 RepID=UPI000825FB7E|nr:ribosomal protein S18-alanine N-acetyltransferase [Robertmurraya korlensis]
MKQNEETQSLTDSLVFRYLKEEDIDQILKIEELSFATPWTRQSFENELNLNQFAVYLVLEKEGQIVGYCGMWLIVDEAHITNIAVLPEFRGQKLGEAILRMIMEIAKKRGAKTMTLEVRVSNEVAQSLYRKLGFMNGGIRKKYYTDNYEDALVMWVTI